MTKQVTVEVAEDAVRKFGGDETRFDREMYETAVVKWHDEGRISSGKGAELLDIPPRRVPRTAVLSPGFSIPIHACRIGR